MKTAAIIAALVGSASAFAPASKVASSTAIQGSVFDDYVGAVDYRGGEMKFDPVSSAPRRDTGSSETLYNVLGLQSE
jgi:hypothetical protein